MRAWIRFPDFPRFPPNLVNHPTFPPYHAQTCFPPNAPASPEPLPREWRRVAWRAPQRWREKRCCSLCSRSEMKRQRYRNSSNSFRSRVFYVSTVPSKLRSNEAPALRHDDETTHGGITTVAGFARESSAFRRSAYRGSKMPPLSAVPKSTKHLPKTLRFPPTCHPLFPPSSPREPSVPPRHLAGPSVSEAWNWRDFC